MHTYKIISLIQFGGRRRVEGISSLVGDVKTKRMLLSKIQSYGLSKEEAEDIRQEVYLQAVLNIDQEKFLLEGNLPSYLMGIARHLSIRASKKEHRRKEILNSYNVDSHSVENDLEDQEGKELMYAIIAKIGGTCKYLLKLWSSGYSMEEIRIEMNLSSPGAARKKKHDCLIKLYKLLDDQPNLATQLKSYYEPF